MFECFAARMARFCAFTLLLGLTAFSVSAVPLSTLEPQSSQKQTTKDVVANLDRHYKKMRFDDQLSERFLEKYIETLDPAKTFFFASDIAEFQQHRKDFDDDFRAGRLDFAYLIFNRYRQRVDVRLKAVIARLEQEDMKFDFSVDEELNIDIDNAEWATDQDTANELWHKRLKSNILNLVLADNTVEEARDLMTKRYQRQLTRLQQQTSGDAYETIVNALTLLYDPHTNFMAPRASENFNINMSLSLQGIGAVLRTEEQYTKVDRIVPGGPAEKQGQLKASDRIVGVGQGDGGEIIDVVDWRLGDVVNLIRGEKNTVVRLSVLKDDDVPKIIRIVRDEVKLEEQAAQKKVYELTDGDKLYKVGIINIPNFYIDFDAYRRRDPDYRSTTRDVKRLLDELEEEGVDGVIVDIRDNGGGSLLEAIGLTDLFIDPGPVVQIRNSRQVVSRESRARSLAVYRGPMVVLINRLSASASEIFAGAIQDYQRGLIVGTQTFGKGTVQTLSPIAVREDGEVREGQIKITESKFYRVSGGSTQHQGVIPDVKFPTLMDFEQIGESAYDNALPYDTIREAPHTVYFDFASILPSLQQRHDQRVAADPDFSFLVDQYRRIQKYRDRKSISLNESARRAEQQRIEQEELALENKRRTAKGLEPLANMDAYEKEAEEEQLERSSSGPITIDPMKDPVLNEAGLVLVDFIKMMSNRQVEKIANF